MAVSASSFEAATPIPAGELHPSTPVVTVALHNTIVHSAQVILDKLYSDAKKVPTKILIATVVGVVIGFIVASL